MIVGAFMKWMAFKGFFSPKMKLDFFGIFPLKEQFFSRHWDTPFLAIGAEYAGIVVTKPL
jgi:hypothetical protein